MKPIPELPPWRDPIVTPAGEMPQPWRRFFEQLVQKIEELEDRLEALEP